MTDESVDSGTRTRSLIAVGLAAIAVLWFGSLHSLVAVLLFRIALPLLAAFAVAVAAAGLGRALRRGWLATTQDPRDESPAGDLIIGLPILGTLFFLAGLFSTSLTLVFPFVAIVGAFLLWRGRAVTQIAVATRPSVGEIAMLAFGAITLLHVFAVAQLPAFSLDEIAYHLTVVKAWVVEGRVVELPLLSHSYFPFGVESASLPLIAMLGNAGAIAAHFLNLLVALATVVFAFRFVEQRAGRAAASVAATALMTTPAMLVTAGWAWNDWPLLGIVLVLLDAVDRDEIHFRNVTLAVAAGLFTKYTFVVPAAALLLVAFVLTSSRVKLLRAAAIGAIAGGVYLIRNVILTGNPVAPLLGPLAPRVSHFRSGASASETLRGYILEPGIADEALGVTLLLLTLCGAVFVTRKMLRTTQLLIASVAATVILAAMMPSSRILVPSLACAALTGAILAFGRATPRVRHVMATSVFLAAALQMSLAIFYFDRLAPFGVMSSQLSEESFLMRQGAYAEARWANEQLPRDSKTLVVGLNALFWFDQPVRGGGNFDGPRMNAYLEAGDAASLHQRLRADGFTHVAIYDRGLLTKDSLHRERATLLSHQSFRNLGTLVNAFATPVAEERDRHLFRLR